MYLFDVREQDVLDLQDNTGLCFLLLWYINVKGHMCAASESKTNFSTRTIKYRKTRASL